MHLSSEAALDLVEGTIADAERRFWSSHIGSCTECIAELLDWSALAGWVTRSHLFSAPDDVLASAMQIFETPPKIMEFRTPFRHIVARIIFDSFAQPAVAGVRRAAAVQQQMLVRHVVSQTEEFDIHLRVSMLEHGRDVLGQILPRDNRTFIKNARLHLRREDKRVGSTKVNDLGEFEFRGVPDGRLSLQIDLPHLTVITALFENVDTAE